jgi:nitrogen fixation protein NifB
MELKKLQDELEGGAKLMRHCRQCRADAVGLLGEDRGQEFNLSLLPETVTYDPSKREAYREIVAKERGDHVEAKKAAVAEVKDVAADAKLLVAVATKGGGRINEHFGHAKEFQVYEAGPEGIGFVGHRKVETQYCEGGWGEDASLDAVIKALEGVEVVLCAKIGDCPKDMLTAAGIRATDDYGFEYIETAIGALYAAEFGIETAAAVA